MIVSGTEVQYLRLSVLR